MRIRFVLMLTLILALATGCAGSGTSGAMHFEELRYHLSGGIAGMDQELLIKADGTYQVTERGQAGASGTLSAAELTGLKEWLAKVDWKGLKPAYVNPRIADGMLEELTLTAGSATHSVKVGTEGGAPKALADLLARLNQTLAARR